MIHMYPSISAMNAFSVGIQGSAYNIANVNTNGFQPVAVHYRSGRPADLGVEPVVTRPKTEAPSPFPPFSGPASSVSGASPTSPANPLTPSNTDLAREMTNLIINQRSFEANAAVVRASDAILGVLVDLKV